MVGEQPAIRVIAAAGGGADNEDDGFASVEIVGCESMRGQDSEADGEQRYAQQQRRKTRQNSVSHGHAWSVL
jgi:hypothetical protein